MSEERRVPKALADLRDQNAATGEAGNRRDAWRAKRDRADRGAQIVAAMFVLAIVFALGLLVVYIDGGQTQFEGLLLFGAFFALGTGLAVWVKVVIDEPQVVEHRDLMSEAEDERQAFAEAFSRAIGEGGVGGRRRFLLRLLGGAGATLAGALFIPLRSLGPGPNSELFTTAWAAGKRVVDDEGHTLRLDDIVPDQVLTVFPEGAIGSADSQAVLIGLRPERTATLDQPTPENVVCYSKVCTHAGCPVGLYRARDGELICPCHQSTFDVYDNATPVAGPAARALPQLPVGVDDEGFLVALGDFPAPIGPGFWNMNDRPAGVDDAGTAAEEATR